MYACGVTTYDYCHVGHAMQAIFYDVFNRYLKFSGYKTQYVRNYTDIDDKIIERAKELNIPALELSEKMIRATKEDMAVLGVRPADQEPRATAYIPQTIRLTQKLIEGGQAYESSGSVYFRVKRFPAYGKLSHQNIEMLNEGVRVESAAGKEDPLDFAIWKSVVPDEIGWESPWGRGRPGWHIECTTLVFECLGQKIDIHGGGRDLVFPHHENEIAQSESLTQADFAGYWIHCGLITVNGQKMSKSLGNSLSIREAVKKAHPLAIRFSILTNHYGSNIDFSERIFQEAYKRLVYFYNTLIAAEDFKEKYAIPDDDQIQSKVVDDFKRAMDDDFNTAQAIGLYSDVFKKLNELLAGSENEKKNRSSEIMALYQSLRLTGNVLGFFEGDLKIAMAQIQRYLLQNIRFKEEQIKHLIDERETARHQRDFRRADEIRTTLLKEKIQLQDSPGSTRWQVVL